MQRCDDHHVRPSAWWRGLLATALTLGLVAGALSSCSTSESEPTAAALEGPPQRGGKLTYGLGAETDGWDPSFNRWSNPGNIVGLALFDRLTAFDDKGDWKPWQAESFIPNDDFTSWEIKMRSGIEFQNGEPLTAQAVADSLGLVRQSLLLANTLMPVDTITVDDELTLTVKMTSPWSTFPNILATQTGVVMAPEMIKMDADTRQVTPIGAGPFRLDNWQRDATLVVKKFDKYWQKAPDGQAYPYLDEVDFQILPDAQSMRNAFESGGVDIIGVGDPYAYDSEKYQVLSSPTSEDNESFIMLNTSKAPFDDPDARRALAFATDRTKLAEAVAADETSLEALKTILADGPFAPGSKWYAGPTGYQDGNPAEAKKLLDAYAAKNGGPLAFTLTAVNTPEVQRLAQALVSQWRDAGVDVNISNGEQTAMINEVLFGNYQAVSWAQFGAPHPDIEYLWWHSSTAEGPITLNAARNKDPELDKALDEARTTTDTEKQKALYFKVQQRLAADVPYIWFTHGTSGIVAAKRVRDVTTYTLPDGSKGLPLIGGIHPITQIWLAA